MASRSKVAKKKAGDFFEKVGEKVSPKVKKREDGKTGSPFFKTDKKGRHRSVSRGTLKKRGAAVTGAAAAVPVAAGTAIALSGDKEEKKTGPQSRRSRRTERTPGTAGGTGGKLSGGAARRKKREETGGRTAGTAGGSGAAPKTRGRVAGKTGGAKTRTLKPTPQMKKDQSMISGIAALAAKDSDKKKSTKSDASADTGKKTFRERRLERMKKRLEGAKSEGRKERIARRIGRVEGRIERSKARKKAGGGMMKSKMSSKGGKMGGKMVRGYAKGDLVEGGAKLLQKMGQRAFEKKYGKTAKNKAIKELNKISGLTPTKKPKTEKQKKLAGADSRASMTKFTKQTPAAKKQAQVKTTEKRLERGFSNGGMAKKGYSKGGAARKSKPRGVGAALRGYGKAMR